MIIISIIVTKNGIVETIDSFDISNKETSNNVIDFTKKYFINLCKEFGFIETNELTKEKLISKGYYIAKYNVVICNATFLLRIKFRGYNLFVLFIQYHFHTLFILILNFFNNIIKIIF